MAMYKSEVTYRRIVALDVLRLPKLCKDVLREQLPELDTHLVYKSDQDQTPSHRRCEVKERRHTEGVDTPNDTLREDLVLV